MSGFAGAARRAGLPPGKGIGTVAKIQIYTTPFCPFCYRAKKLLDNKRADYEEIDVLMRPALRQEMTERSGSRTVPQIFVDGEYLSDCEGLYALEDQGDLDNRLGLGA